LYRLNRSDGIDPLEPLVALGIEGITGVLPVSGGMDTLIWRVETVHGTYALRLFQPNQRDQYWREIRAMEIVGTLGVPVPRITVHGMWGDRPAILMEWCDGRTVLDEALVDEALAVVLVVLVLPLEVPCASLTSFWKSDCSVDSALLDDVFPLFSCEIRLCRPDARSEP
jgi:hypothetical protein